MNSLKSPLPSLPLLLSPSLLQRINFTFNLHLFCRATQHVPLEEYISNTRSIIAHLRSRNISSIILITPPPISEPARIAHVLATYNVKLEAPERTNEVTGQYADAVVALGAELGLPVVNLWQNFHP